MHNRLRKNAIDQSVIWHFRSIFQLFQLIVPPLPYVIGFEYLLTLPCAQGQAMRAYFHWNAL